MEAPPPAGVASALVPAPPSSIGVTPSSMPVSRHRRRRSNAVMVSETGVAPPTTPAVAVAPATPAPVPAPAPEPPVPLPSTTAAALERLPSALPLPLADTELLVVSSTAGVLLLVVES